jgi:hypothetical protein
LSQNISLMKRAFFLLSLWNIRVNSLTNPGTVSKIFGSGIVFIKFTVHHPKDPGLTNWSKNILQVNNPKPYMFNFCNGSEASSSSVSSWSMVQTFPSRRYPTFSEFQDVLLWTTPLHGKNLNNVDYFIASVFSSHCILIRYKKKQ